MRHSVFDLFRPGIGPSSSHTVGPMRAALAFARELERLGVLVRTRRVAIELFGSLAATGRGHQTDNAILRGLSGEDPATASCDARAEACLTKSIALLGRHPIDFDYGRDFVFDSARQHLPHPNTMRLKALGAGGAVLLSHTYLSLGGGFISRDDEQASETAARTVPYPYSNADELLERGRESGLAIWQMVVANETAFGWKAAERALEIWSVMRASIERGLKAEGVLPGGLQVPRRAPGLYQRLATREQTDPLAALDWLSLYAIAASEENAAGSRIVTAPTNGAAGIIPAVARYYQDFVAGANDDGIVRLLLSAGAIGLLFKENASISGAEVGCQGEVGVACSMAAAGLAAALGGTNQQVEHAAEIGMEHHLGLTCDPVAGLVQIPCIERNAMGALQAVNSCRLAMLEQAGHKVSLDQVIRVMHQTGLDMLSRYKETSLGGLALHVAQC